MAAPNPVTASSASDCVRLCNSRSGCVFGVYKRATGECFHKAPMLSSDYLPGRNFVTGYIWIETINPPPPPPQTAPVVVQPTSDAPVIAFTTTGVSTASAQEIQTSKLPEKLTASAVKTSTTAIPAGSSENQGLNGAVIGGGAGGGLLLLILGVGAFVYFKRYRKTDDNSPTTALGQPSGASRNEDSTLPAYESGLVMKQDRLPQSPPAFLSPRTNIVVSNVPGYYRAIQDHTAESEGQLTIVEGQRLYVTSMPNEDGWCKALL
ncbi:hypothetical protein BDR26DRAFT_866396, partial [Obelidium mucronatum]